MIHTEVVDSHQVEEYTVQATPPPPPSDQPEDSKVLWTVEDVAKRLQVSVSKVYELDMLGQIPSFKLGGLRRFLPAAIEAWAQNVAAQGGLKVATEDDMRRARAALRRQKKIAQQQGAKA